MKTNYYNILTGDKIRAIYYQGRGDNPRLRDLISHIVGIKSEEYYAVSKEYEIRLFDEYGFDTTLTVQEGDYACAIGGYLKIFTPASFAAKYRILPVSLQDESESAPEALEPEGREDKAEKTREGFPKWVGDTQTDFKKNVIRDWENLTKKPQTFKQYTYTEPMWWGKLENLLSETEFFAEEEEDTLENDRCLNGTCFTCSDDYWEEKDDVNITTVDAYRITENFDEWDFAEWLTPGDKFALTHSIGLNQDGILKVDNPRIRIYSPKTEGEARPGDLVIRVCAHRYTIQACVPNEKEVD
jgi:hypothetical protein